MLNSSPETILTRAELIYLMDRVGATHLAGMELKEFSLPVSRLMKLKQSGKQSLLARSLINKTTFAINSELEGLVKAISFRDRAIIVVRGIGGKGKQLFIYNFYGSTFVQHTMPEEGKHRLEKISTSKNILDRIGELIFLKPVSKNKRPRYSISRQDFEQIESVASSNPNKALLRLKSLGLPEEATSLIVKALNQPIFTLSIACLGIKKDEIINATSCGVFAIEEASWGIWPGNNGSEIMIFPVDGEDVRSMLLDWVNPDEKHGNKKVSVSKRKIIGAGK